MSEAEALNDVGADLDAALGRLISSYAGYAKALAKFSRGGKAELFEARQELTASLEDFGQLEHVLLGESFVREPSGDPIPLVDRPEGGTLFDIKGTWRVVVDDVSRVRAAAAESDCGGVSSVEEAVVTLVNGWGMTESAFGDEAMTVYSRVTCSQVDRVGDPFTERGLLFTESPKKRKKRKKK